MLECSMPCDDGATAWPTASGGGWVGTAFNIGTLLVLGTFMVAGIVLVVTSNLHGAGFAVGTIAGAVVARQRT